MIKNAIFEIRGGIGHHFNVSVIFRKYKEEHPERDIIVFCPWLHTLHHNKNIDYLYDPGDYLARENLVKKGNNIYHTPDVYTQNLQLRNGYHIKQIIAEQCGIEVVREDKLDYYPMDQELEDAYSFKKNMCDGKKLGIVQCEGSGIIHIHHDGRQEVSPLAVLKQLPTETANEVLKATEKDIFWVQIRTSKEKDLDAGYELVDFDHRKMFALLTVADIGFGTDSFAQHLMSGAFEIPFIMVHGRSRPSAYAHPATISVGNPLSCTNFGCEAPTFGVPNICPGGNPAGPPVCMKSIKPKQIIDEIEKVLKENKK